MEFFGVPLETIYLVTLIIAGSLTLLYVVFGDVVEGITEGSGFLSPTLILSFLTIFSASGYLFEVFSLLTSMLIMLFSIIIALILVTLLNVFILIPLSKAEESLVYTTDSLKGRVGKVIIPIPVDGFGEVVLPSKSGTIAKSAVSFDGIAINEGEQVLVIDVLNGVLHVSPHERSEDFNL